MNQKVLKTLEYDKVLLRLTNYATCESGRKACENLLPINDAVVIETMLEETNAAVERLLRIGDISFSGTHDPREMLKRVEVGGTLNTTELISIASLLQVSARAKSYGKPSDSEEREDCLSESFQLLEPLRPLREEIERCILSEDEIADDASPGLKAVRRKMKQKSEQIRSKLNEMLQSAKIRDCLQDFVITTRSGRFCLPVRAEYKAQVPGMVHDQSKTGQTLFIEPMAVVALNNELREAQAAEQEEIDKILATLSISCEEHHEAIESDYVILEKLDFIFARGKYGLAYNGTKPLLKREGFIKIRGAVHPLLDPKTAVPIDLSLGEDFKLLIVTGPNTGGKTVSLKTLGLLSLMAQSGLFIPARDRSKLLIFDEIYADIGDEQSIEQSLSTFSSHMTNLIHITEAVEHKKDSEKALVLLDELCAGTDPTEGAALATALLECLKNAGAHVMATTHYSELKVYALQTKGVENASCEFDVTTLSPTYRLLIGVPGRSNAFNIAGKLGLKQDIISDAKSRMNENDRTLEDVMAELMSKHAELDQKREKIDKETKRLNDLEQKVKNRRTQLEKQKEEILSKANQKASNILKDAKDTADAAIRNIHKYGDVDPDVKKLEKQRNQLGKKLKGTLDKSTSSIRVSKKGAKVDAKTLHIGDDVTVLSMNARGHILSLPNEKGELEVQMGILRSRVKLSDIALIEEEKPSKKASGNGSSSGTIHSHVHKSSTISPEIKLLGLRPDEAISKLDKYLDDAYIAHLGSVRIVHGKGTGALREAVRDYLRTQSIVSSFHLAEYGEGDSGVTIANFTE